MEFMKLISLVCSHERIIGFIVNFHVTRLIEFVQLRGRKNAPLTHLGIKARFESCADIHLTQDSPKTMWILTHRGSITQRSAASIACA